MALKPLMALSLTVGCSRKFQLYDSSGIVAEFVSDLRRDEEIHDYACVFAAAPLLLSACRSALKAIEHQGGGPRPHGSEDEWDEIKAAIAGLEELVSPAYKPDP